MKRNAFYAQSGGVTSVINATAASLILTAKKYPNHIGKVFAGKNGIIGALREDLIDTSKESMSSIKNMMEIPGGAFGSCRYKLKDYDEDASEYERLIEVFKAHNIGYFFYNGGNDSADTAYKISKLGEKVGYDIKCIAIPKTVDNDLALTDCCPGFGSVANVCSRDSPLKFPISCLKSLYDKSSRPSLSSNTLLSSISSSILSKCSDV